MERTGYESLGTLTVLDQRVDHLRSTIQWALDHPGMAQYQWGTFEERLQEALDLDEAHEMNRLYDEAHALNADMLDLARRKVEAEAVLGPPREAKF